MLEDLGVVPDQIHRMTRDDLFEGNPDLIAAAGALLANLPKRRLVIRVGQASDAGQEVLADCVGFDRLDVHVDGRPLGSLDVEDGENPFALPVTGGGALDFRGFAGGVLVAARRVVL